MAGDRTFGGRLESRTDQYLEQLTTCVEAVVPLIDRYRDGREYDAIVERIHRLESDCDETKRAIGGLVLNIDPEATGIRLTWIYLHADRLLELYETLDSIANSAEQFATELDAIEPPRRKPCLDGLYRMAERAVAAIAELEYTVSAFVRALCRPDHTVSLTERIETIRTIERNADAIRNGVLSVAFDGAYDGTSVVYRQLAVLLDAVIDAVEDVTDRMNLISSTEAWLDIDIYPTPDAD